VIKAEFFVDGEYRETREVTREWLERAQATHENVLLADGNPYHVGDIELDGSGSSARVELVPPRFTRAS
jgi:hypothetical protein